MKKYIVVAAGVFLSLTSGCGSLRSSKLDGNGGTSVSASSGAGGGQPGTGGTGGPGGTGGITVAGSAGSTGSGGVTTTGGMGAGALGGSAGAQGGHGGAAATGTGGSGAIGSGGLPGTGGAGGAATGGVPGTGGRGSGGSGGSACQPAPAELCFNGIDDDCDGLADCADPACSSVAVCVPADQAFSLGITIDASSDCPIGYQMGTSTLIHQGVTGDTACDGCTCSMSSHCSTTLRAYPSTTACTGTPVTLASLDETSKCVPLPAGHAGLPHVDNFVASGTCSAGGSATPSTWSWSTTMKFCPADPPGKGCKTGYACVHKSPSTYCEIGSGSCTAGFTAVSGGTWYTAGTDSRSCAKCGCQVTSAGDCSGSRVFEHPDGECAVTNPSEFVLLQGDRCDGFGETSGFTTADLNVSFTGVSCAGSSALSGAVTPTGARTVCCE